MTVLAASLLALLWTAVAQRTEAQPTPRGPAFSATTELARLVVAVEDEEGRPIPDLRREDFVIREDGREQAVEVCARAADSVEDGELRVNLALLLDVSGSMLEQVRLSRLATTGFLDAVPRAAEVLVVLFHHEVRGFRYVPLDKEATLKLIADTSPSGGTALYDALGAALNRLRDAPGRQVVVLVTDGDDHKSRSTAAEALEVVRRSRATIYPILMRNAIAARNARTLEAESFLDRIARTTGGRLFRPSGAKEIRAIYDRILHDLSSQYILGFTSDNPRQDEAYRRLEIRVRRPKLKVRHRDGYFAAQAPS